MLLVDYGVDQADVSRLDPNSNYIWKKVHQEFNDFCRALTGCAQCCKMGSPTLCQFVPLARRLRDLNSHLLTDQSHFDFSDLAIMLYYYDTHRRPLEPTIYKNGRTGYFGVLQELISEVLIRGTNRLQRKLSVNVNKLIPKVVRDPKQRKRMISIAEDIAVQHGLCLYRSAKSVISKPLFERIYKDGFLVQKQRMSWVERFNNACTLQASKRRELGIKRDE